MNTTFKFLAACLVMFVIPLESCTQTAGVESGSFRLMLKTLLSHTVPEISATTAAQQEEVLFLDTREEAEYEVSHIKDALFVGYDNFKIETLAAISKDQPLILYCSVGYRSEKISEQLIAAGFTDVKNLYGGIFEWKNQGLPVVDTSDEPTERVHAFSRSWGIWLKNGEKVY